MDDVESGSEGQVCLVDGMEHENGVDEDDEVNGDDLDWVCGGVLDWAEVNIVGVGVNVDESPVSEVVHDGLGDGVGRCCPLCDDVQVNHDKNDDGSCVDEVIEQVWYLVWRCD